MSLHAIRIPHLRRRQLFTTPALPTPASAHVSALPVLPACGGGTLRSSASQRALAESLQAGRC